MLRVREVEYIGGIEVTIAGTAKSSDKKTPKTEERKTEKKTKGTHYANKAE